VSNVLAVFGHQIKFDGDVRKRPALFMKMNEDNFNENDETKSKDLFLQDDEIPRGQVEAGGQ
jgi:hypothetical protein